ncbi:MAG: hypothetical protein K6G64_02940 [Eubacterium sp.]|nr:hypothetical protein [Eubacterium sp.]
MSDSMKEKIFDFVYYEALKDATLRNTCESKSRDVVLGETKVAKQIKEEVYNYIKTILNNEMDEDTCIETIRKVAKKTKTDAPGFTFGNAQKLVNMTAKYFFILTYEQEKKRKNFRHCHCPMDESMIEAVKGYHEELKELVKEKDSQCFECFKYKKSIDKSWSTLTMSEEDQEKYLNFQKWIKEISRLDSFVKKYGKGNCSLEIDFLLWKGGQLWL